MKREPLISPFPNFVKFSSLAAQHPFDPSSLKIATYTKNNKVFQSLNEMLKAKGIINVVNFPSSDGEGLKGVDQIDILICLDDVPITVLTKVLKKIREQQSPQHLAIICQYNENWSKAEFEDLSAMCNDFLSPDVNGAEINARIKNQYQMLLMHADFRSFSSYYGAELGKARDMIATIEAPQQTTFKDMNGQIHYHLDIQGYMSFGNISDEVHEDSDEGSAVLHPISNNVEYIQGYQCAYQGDVLASFFTVRGRLFPVMVNALLQGRMQYIMSLNQGGDAQSIVDNLRQYMRRIVPQNIDTKILCLKWNAQKASYCLVGDVSSFHYYTKISDQSWQRIKDEDLKYGLYTELLINKAAFPSQISLDIETLKEFPHMCLSSVAERAKE